MNIQYTWQFPALEAYPTKEDKTNVVFTVHWRLSGTDETYTSEVYGSIGLSPFEGDDQDFVAYEDLTPEIITSWVEDAMGEEQVENYKTSIAGSISALANPTSVTLSPPWNTIQQGLDPSSN